MSECVAFLRGMNVGGHRLSNVQLQGCFAELGFSDASTFRASGNVIFTAAAEHITELAAHIEAGLEASLGYAVPVFLRSAPEVMKIAARQPFEKPLIEASKGKLQVALLHAKPPARARQEVLGLASEQDALAFGDRELYWLASGGILESPLDFKAIGRLLGPTTLRTRGTVERLVAKYFIDRAIDAATRAPLP